MMTTNTATICPLTFTVICWMAASQHTWNSTFSSGDTLRETTAKRLSNYGEIHVDAITVLKCLNCSQFLQYYAESGIIHMNSTTKVKGKRECQIGLSARGGKLWQFYLPPRLRGVAVSLWDNCAQKKIRFREKNPPFAFSVGPNVTLWIVQYFSNPLSVPFNISFVSRTQQPQMQVHRMSNTSGYILSPLWDGLTPYSPGLDSWTQVSIPEGLGMMVSYRQLHLSSYARLAIYQAGRDSSHLVTLLYRPRMPIPTSTFSQTIHVHFQSGKRNDDLTKGFRLVFTLHSLSTLLQKAAKGARLVKDRFGYEDFYDKQDLWNCSVSSWEEHRVHFPCNSKWSCVLGEDEESCPYTHAELCGPGQLWTNDSCHRLFTSPKMTFWNQSSWLCGQHGGQLSSLNTPYEWDTVTRYLLVPHNQNAFFGLSTFPVHVNPMYEFLWRWEDKSTAFFSPGLWSTGFRTHRIKPFCGSLVPDPHRQKPLQGGFHHCFDRSSTRNLTFATLCEFKLPQVSQVGGHPKPPALSHPKNITFPISHVTCIPEERSEATKQGHVTHEFLACDPHNGCLRGEKCGSQFDLAPPPAFLCSSEKEEVPYMLVCDHRSDCIDGSDEEFCVFPPCDLRFSFHCGDGQCIGRHQRCDYVLHCVRGADEEYCYSDGEDRTRYYSPTPATPAIVDMDHRGLLVVKPLRSVKDGLLCPSSHFQCSPPNNYCLPVYLRCNQVYDCLTGEDEADCAHYTCPGYYRCRDSSICVHADQVCDHRYGQCPHNDDELLCGFSCPPACRCFGMAFYCSQPVPAVSEHQDLRFLNADGSNMTLMDVEHNTMLVHLSLARCSLRQLQAPDLPNLKSLDLSHNLISVIAPGIFGSFRNLTALSLADNPFPFQSSIPAITELIHLRRLDLSYVVIDEFNASEFEPLGKLHTLNLSHSSLKHVVGAGFQALKALRSIDLRQCQVEEFPVGIFDKLLHLEWVISPNYKLCCPDVLPAGFNPHSCHAPTDPVSSCQDLLKSNSLRIALSLLVVVSLSGNLLALVYWTLIQKHFQSFVCGVFMIHLCVSDFVRGIYLMVIVVADRVLQGGYMWRDVGWRQSATCTCAGMLFVVSLHVSMFLVCVMTMDRVMALFAPLTPFQFGPMSAHVVSAMLWAFALVLAAIPLSPAAWDTWQLYRTSVVCVPLPPADNAHTGLSSQWKEEAQGAQLYYSGLFHVLHTTLCVVVAAGQAPVTWTVSRTLVMATDCSRKMQDVMVAQRVLQVTVANMAGWLLAGVVRVVAAVTHLPVSEEVQVFMTVLVLSLSSALSPGVYTLTLLLQDRKKAREQLLLTILARQKGRQQIKHQS